MVLFVLCDMLGLACVNPPLSLPLWYKQVIVEAANVKVGVGVVVYQSSNIICSLPTLSSFSLFISVGGLTSKRGPRPLNTSRQFALELVIFMIFILSTL